MVSQEASKERQRLQCRDRRSCDIKLAMKGYKDRPAYKKAVSGVMAARTPMELADVYDESRSNNDKRYTANSWRGNMAGFRKIALEKVNDQYYIDVGSKNFVRGRASCKAAVGAGFFPSSSTCHAIRGYPVGLGKTNVSKKYDKNRLGYDFGHFVY